MGPPSSSTKDLAAAYDVIIVGGGQAGLTLASRLSENASIKVLVLEAGPANTGDPMILTPPFSGRLRQNEQYDWAFQTEPQAGYEGRQITQNRGKGLGGTSAINLNMIVFPSTTSLDAWAKLGNPGWDFESMSQYYRKCHTFHEPSADVKEALGLDYLDPEAHGKNGPIQVSYGKQQSDFDKAWTRTFKTLGYKSTADPITGRHFGAYNAPASIDPASKTRSYAATAYFGQHVTERANLHIVTEATVERLVFDDSQTSPTIAGVAFTDHEGQQKTVKSSETVLCAGVFQSPQILELSGIGNPKVLKQHSIEPQVDLPGVGENLQDHANVGVSFESKLPTFDSFRDPAVIGAAMKDYQESKTGPLSTSVYCASYMPCMSFLDSANSAGAQELKALLDKHANTGPSFPAQKQQFDLIRSTVEDPARSSIEYLLAPVQMNAGQSSAAAKLDDSAKSHDYITIFSSLSHPFSRGTVHVKSADPKARPAIDPQYFAHTLDVEIVARHLMYLETLSKAEPLASLLVPNGRRIPESIDLTNIDETREAVKTGFTTYHPCGTCAMMPKDIGGVVDERLKVHGVKGLRVVDASIFPLIPRGNIQSTVYATAEKAADMIREDLQLR